MGPLDQVLGMLPFGQDAQGRGLLAHPDEGDGPAGDVPHRERRAAARVAVELGQDDRVDADRLIEAVATVTASCPVIASTTSSTWCGETSRRIALSSPSKASSMWSRPAVSRISG